MSLTTSKLAGHDTIPKNRIKIKGIRYTRKQNRFAFRVRSTEKFGQKKENLPANANFKMATKASGKRFFSMPFMVENLLVKSRSEKIGLGAILNMERKFAYQKRCEKKQVLSK